MRDKFRSRLKRVRSFIISEQNWMIMMMMAGGRAGGAVRFHAVLCVTRPFFLSFLYSQTPGKGTTLLLLLMERSSLFEWVREGTACHATEFHQGQSFDLMEELTRYGSYGDNDESYCCAVHYALPCRKKQIPIDWMMQMWTDGRAWTPSQLPQVIFRISTFKKGKRENAESSRK